MSCTRIRGLSTTQSGALPGVLPRTKRELVETLPPIYPHDLREAITKDVAALERTLVVLDDDPTGTQTVHSVPVLADWSVDTLTQEVRYVCEGVHCFVSGLQ